MDSVLSIAESNIGSLMEQINVSSNNIANANTTGYRSKMIVGTAFAQAYQEAESAQQSNSRLYADPTPGTIRATGRSLDLALAGSGFFKLESPFGTVLTRDGQFELTGDGRLVDANGWPLLISGQVEPLTKEMVVKPDGRIFKDGNVVGNIEVAVSAGHGHKEIAPGMFLVGDEDTEALSRPEIMQSSLEGSNVNLLGETTKMMIAMRSIESSQKLVRNYDAMLDTAISTLGEF